MVDTSPAILLMFVAAAVYLAAGILLARSLYKRLLCASTVGNDRSARLTVWLSRCVMGLAAAGLLCMLYARLIEPFWLQVEHVRISTPKLQPGSRAVRLVVIGDTHCDPQERAESRIANCIKDIKPDAILFAGDAINSEGGLQNFRKLMQRLAAIAPTFAVYGNWETWWFPQLDLYGGTGVKALRGGIADLTPQVSIGGAGVDRPGQCRLIASKLAERKFRIVLHHFPEVGAELLETGRADLAIGGDTHGGQVRLPLVGPMVRISRAGRYYDIGLHRIGNGWLYVNRGIGMEGGNVPRVRFNCRPEVTVIEIVPAGTPTDG